MANYRIYRLNRANRIASASDAECANDTDAFACAAATLGTDATAEIWQGPRCVGQVRGGVISLGPPQPSVPAGQAIWPAFPAGEQRRQPA